MNKKYIILSIIVVIAIIVAAILSSKYNKSNVEVTSNVSSSSPAVGTYEYHVIHDAGSTTTDAQGNQIYTNTIQGFSLTYPHGWYIGSDILGYGSLQFYNFDWKSCDAGGTCDSVTQNGKSNKIEMTIISRSVSSYTSTQYPEVSRSKKTSVVNGTTITQEDVELQGVGKLRVYFIPIPNDKDNQLIAVIYGYPNNFSVLDGMIQSLRWNK